MVTQRRLIADLDALGLTTGQTVVVHSSLRSIGYVEGGAQTVVQAFQAVVGSTGLLVFPTFTYSGGMIVLLGVGHTSNSTIHVGESHAAVRYRAVPFSPDDPPFARIVSAAGSIDTPLHEPPGCSKAFGVIEYPLRRRGLVHDGKVGAALAQRIPGLAVIATVKALLGENPAALLCTDPQCYRCTTARTMVRTEGATNEYQHDNATDPAGC